MLRSGFAAVCARTAIALAGFFLPAVPTQVAPAPATRANEAPTEIRALWVLRTSLSSPQSIATLVRAAHDHGFNTLLVQVRGRGDAYYSSSLEPRAAELQRQPDSFDPLALVLESAHAAGLRVHAWINLNLVASAVDLPIARTHVLQRHPDWLMVPRDIAQELAAIPPDSPAYVGKLARWTRAQTGELEGLYASPIIPAAADHAQSVVRDIARRYAVDGVHLDYARYPSPRFDYSRYAIAEFRALARLRLADAVRRDLDRLDAVDLFAYPDALPDDWRVFRVSRMTALMSRLRTAVKAERPNAVVTVATAPDVREAYDARLQDWGTWVENHLVDAVCPMAYTPEADRFTEQITAARDLAGGPAVWAGIGAYRLTPAQTIENIRTARRLGAAGFVLFSYDSLTDPHASVPDYLATVARGAFGPTGSPSGAR